MFSTPVKTRVLSKAPIKRNDVMADKKVVLGDEIAALEEKVSTRDKIIEKLLRELDENYPSMDLAVGARRWVENAKEKGFRD